MLSYKDLKFPKPPKDRPYVIVEMVMSLDGKIRSGKFWPIGSETDRRLMEELEGRADMVMQGAGTVRVWHGKIRVEGAKPFATITKSGRIGKLIRSTLVFTTGQVALKISGPHQEIKVKNLRAMLKYLRKQGVKLLLVEGGGILNWHFFKENVVDELFLTVAPKLFGGRDYKSIVDGKQFAIPRRGRLISLSQHDNELFLRYTFSNVRLKSF